MAWQSPKPPRRSSYIGKGVKQVGVDECPNKLILGESEFVVNYNVVCVYIVRLKLFEYRKNVENLELV